MDKDSFHVSDSVITPDITYCLLIKAVMESVKDQTCMGLFDSKLEL